MGHDSLWLNAGIQMELEQLENYLYELTKALETNTESFVRRIESESMEMSEDDRNDYFEWHSDKHWELTEVFPIIMNNSLN